MLDIDKRQLLDTIKQRISAELDRVKSRARQAAEGATHEENRAEGDKDMRATEASYIARGHSGRVGELEESLARLSSLELKQLDPGAPIESSALLELEHAGKRLHYFLVPAAGGERVQLGGIEIQTLTPTSPLGAALLGLKQGDEAEVPARVAGQSDRVYQVLKVR